MKKFVLALAALIAASAANAITLFPHFVDVAGDYETGTTEKFVKLNIPTSYWRVSPALYEDLKSAEEYLQETLPFSSYSIERSSRNLEDGTVVITYTSSLEADGLNKDKWSRLYLVQSPKGPLYVGLSEDQIN